MNKFILVGSTLINLAHVASVTIDQHNTLVLNMSNNDRILATDLKMKTLISLLEKYDLLV